MGTGMGSVLGTDMGKGSVLDTDMGTDMGSDLDTGTGMGSVLGTGMGTDTDTGTGMGMDRRSMRLSKLMQKLRLLRRLQCSIRRSVQRQTSSTKS